jgi:hypothetical protein
MSDFAIEVLENNNQLEVESSIINEIDIAGGDNFLLEATYPQTTVNIEIEQSEAITLQINTEYVGNVIFAGDVIGLDTYIANFIDDYEIDCGSP